MGAPQLTSKELASSFVSSVDANSNIIEGALLFPETNSSKATSAVAAAREGPLRSSGATFQSPELGWAPTADARANCVPLTLSSCSPIATASGGAWTDSTGKCPCLTQVQVQSKPPIILH